MRLPVRLIILAALIPAVFGAAPAADDGRRPPGSRAEIALSFAPVVKEAAPAVVNVFSRTRLPPARLDPFFADPFFRRFFGDRVPPRASPRDNSLGSGVIVDPDGLIVTNHHVVDGADEIRVVLADRREFAATVIGAAPRVDLALLRIDSGDDHVDPLPSLPLGDSDRLEVGDLVLAIGNPFGIGQTVTTGIVSALGRLAPDADSDLSFIQTDAAINPGNSGGALVTLDGRLVGINSAIMTRGGGSIGIGFAIPVNLVKALVRSVESGGRGLARPWLGADGQAVDGELARALALDRPRGVLINRVHPEGPAARAGLRPGDVVLAVDGVEVSDPRELRFRLAIDRLGDRAALRVWRRGAAVDAELALEPAPREPAPQVTRLDGPHPLAGATVANMSPGFNEEIGLDTFRRGVVVLDVARRSPAARLGLRGRDVVVAVGDQEVGSVAQLGKALARPHAAWSIVIDRDGQRLATVIGG